MAVEYETLVQGGHSKFAEEIFKKVKAKTEALDEISDDISDLKSALDALKITNTASGAIASFPDGAAMPMESLTVSLSPIQEGSGDPSPDNVRPITGRDIVRIWRDATYDPSADPALTIQLGQTVYGGTLDVTTGVLTVDSVLKNIADFDDIATGTTDTSGKHRFNLATPGIKRASDANILGVLNCSCYPNVTALDTFRVTLGASVSHNSDTIYIYDPEYFTATPAEFKTAKGDVQLCYELAEPFTVQLTPEQLTTLKGQNNVWSDADSVEVEYVADPKLYIARLTEPDADMVADANITSGHYFMVGNTLYLATANIASGAAITPGVNCTRTNLAAALNAINA